VEDSDVDVEPVEDDPNYLMRRFVLAVNRLRDRHVWHPNTPLNHFPR
jgi:hypothetical protein